MTDKNEILEELASRVRRLEDEAAIVQLRRNCFSAVDKLDYAAFAENFTEDAVIDIPFMNYHGSVQGMVEIYQSMIKDNPAIPFHIGYNPSICLLDEDNAEGTWSLFYYGFFKKNKALSHVSGSYVERYSKTSQGWKISKSRATMDFSFSVPFDPKDYPTNPR